MLFGGYHGVGNRRRWELDGVVLWATARVAGAEEEEERKTGASAVAHHSLAMRPSSSTSPPCNRLPSNPWPTVQGPLPRRKSLACGGKSHTGGGRSRAPLRGGRRWDSQGGRGPQRRASRGGGAGPPRRIGAPPGQKRDAATSVNVCAPSCMDRSSDTCSWLDELPCGMDRRAPIHRGLVLALAFLPCSSHRQATGCEPRLR